MSLIPLTTADYGESSPNLGQFTDEFDTLDNVSVRVLIERNATLNAMELNFSSGKLDLQDFTTFGETDPANRLTQTDMFSNFTGLRRGDGTTRLVKDNGVGSFGLSWTYRFIFSFTVAEAGDADSRVWIRLFGIGNNAVDWATDPRVLITVEQVGNNDALFTLQLRIDDTAAGFDIDTSGNLNVGTVYYASLIRDNGGDDVTLVLRTGSHSGPIDTTLSTTLAAFSDTMRYIFAPARKFSATDPNDWITGYIQNLGNMTGGYVPAGHFSTTDYLDQVNGSTLVQLTNATIPASTGITVQFSQDNSTWVNNVNGSGSNTLTAGFYAIDLRDLNWSGLYHLRYNFSSSDPLFTPRLYQSRLITTQGEREIVIQNVTGDFVLYNATSILTIVGTESGGNTLNNTYWRDGITYNVTEVVGNPGLEVRFNFTGIPENSICLYLSSCVGYVGVDAHDIHIDVWNFTASAWIHDGDITAGTCGYVNLTLACTGEDFNSGGLIQARYHHDAPGNINDILRINHIQLRVFAPYVVPALPGAGAVTIIESDFPWIAIAIILMCVAYLLFRSR